MVHFKGTEYHCNPAYITDVNPKNARKAKRESHNLHRYQKTELTGGLAVDRSSDRRPEQDEMGTGEDDVTASIHAGEKDARQHGRPYGRSQRTSRLHRVFRGRRARRARQADEEKAVQDFSDKYDAISDLFCFAVAGLEFFEVGVNLQRLRFPTKPISCDRHFSRGCEGAADHQAPHDFEQKGKIDYQSALCATELGIDEIPGMWVISSQGQEPSFKPELVHSVLAEIDALTHNHKQATDTNDALVVPTRRSLILMCPRAVRGGAVAGCKDSAVVVVEDETVAFDADALPDASARHDHNGVNLAGVRKDDMRGRLGDVNYCAATTRGDGACALHAAFGAPSLAGVLFLEDARGTLRDMLPPTMQEAAAVLPPEARGVLASVMLSLWAEFVKPAAASVIADYEAEDVQEEVVDAGAAGDARALEREARLYWELLPETLQENVLAFVRQHAFDDQRRNRLDVELMALWSQLFVDEYEESLVRPLAMMLGCVPSCAIDFRSLPVNAAKELETRTGTDPNRSFLSKVAGYEGKTRYQALFLIRIPAFDSVRRSFFLNACYRSTPAGAALVASSLERLADHVASELGQRQERLLRNLADVISRRMACYGELDAPQAFKNEEAWPLYRDVVQNEGYWFSPNEVLLFAALQRRNVRVLLYHAGSATFQLLGSLEAFPGTPLITIALDPGDAAAGNVRGHFSRLFSESEWDEGDGQDSSEDEPDAVSNTGSEDSGAPRSVDDASSSAAPDSDPSEAQPSLDVPPPPFNAYPRPSKKASAFCASFKDRTGCASCGVGDGQDKGDDMGDDAFSDVSIDSDIFHVEALPEGSREWQTEEDADLARVDHIASLLRDHPLLPPAPGNAEQSFTDVQSGVSFPIMHCAFRGCTWAIQNETNAYKNLEASLKFHLEHTHLQAMRLPAECVADIMAYYCGAIAQKEQQRMPIIGPSIDRRTFKLLRQVYHSAAIGGRACNSQRSQDSFQARRWTED